MSQEHFSGIGAELSVLIPLPWYSLIVAQLFDTKNPHYFRSSSFATVDYTKSGKVDGWEDYVYVGRFENFFELSDNWSLKISASTSLGQSGYVQDNKVSLYGGDFYLKWRDITSGNDAMFFALTGDINLLCSSE